MSLCLVANSDWDFVTLRNVIDTIVGFTLTAAFSVNAHPIVFKFYKHYFKVMAQFSL